MMTQNLTSAVRREVFDIQDPSINLTTVNSDVKIVESNDGRTTIELYADAADAIEQARNANIVANGSKITIELDKKNRSFREFFTFHGGGVQVLLRLPKTAEVDVKAVSSDIEIEVTLLNLDLVTVSGDVLILQNPTTRCNVKTVSGDITTHTFSGCDYSLKSVSGDIAVHLAPGLEIEVDGKSVSGDMSSEISFDGDSDENFASAGSVRIDASTVSGDFAIARN